MENWLVRMLRYAYKRGDGVDWTFYCALGRPGMMDDEARALGARVVHSSVPLNQKLAFVRALRAEMRRGKYDILHCHHDLMNAVYLIASIGVPIRRRIVHVHNADENLLTPSRFKQNFFREPMRWICLSKADSLVGISNHTLDTFLAGRPRRPNRDKVQYYGIDPAPFVRVSPDPKKFRRELGLGEDALILLFAGRIVPEKNPLFTLDVLADLKRLETRAVALFAGAGSQEEPLLKHARRLGVQNSVRLLGWRNDLPDVMSSSDWFILPRPERPPEGFGMAVVEAQLAGMRMLLSEGIMDDPILPTASFRRLALAAGPGAWARSAMELLHGPTPSAAQAQAALLNSPMDMDRAFDALTELYS